MLLVIDLATAEPSTASPVDIDAAVLMDDVAARRGFPGDVVHPDQLNCDGLA